MAARGEAVLHVESLTGKKLAAAFSTSTQTNTDGKSRSHGILLHHYFPVN